METAHVVVAAAIAYKVGNPALSLPLAFGSHFILEKVPHWNPHLNTELKKYGSLTLSTKRIIVLDTALALILGSFIAWLKLPDVNQALVILFACFLGALPDLVEAPYFLWHKKNLFLEKVVGFQKSVQSDASVIPGILTQLLTILTVFWWIMN